MLRASNLLCLALLFALTSCDGGGSKRKSVVLITLDTTRADFVSSYGHVDGTTPRLDALAQEGVLFERAFTASAVTPVSHASILSGLYQYEHGVRVIAADSGFRLPADTQTMTTVLKSAGYQVAAIHSAPPVSGTWGFNQGFDHFDSFDVEIEKRSVPKRDAQGRPLLDAEGKMIMVERAAPGCATVAVRRVVWPTATLARLRAALIRAFM